MAFLQRLGQALPGLLDSPGLNLGIGLLAAGGPRPVGQGSGTGERLADALQFTTQRRAQSMELQTARESLMQKKLQREAVERLRRLSTSPGLTPEQQQFMGLLTELDPAAGARLAASAFFPSGDRQQAQSPIGKMLADLEIAEQRGDRRSAEALRKQVDAALAVSGADFDDLRAARNDTIKNSQEFLAAQAGFDRVQAGFAAASPAGDIAGVFGFMKTIDPSSVVRENEFATVENAGSIPERIRGLYNRLLRGERLTPDQRADFTAQAQAQFGKSVAAQQRLVDDARGFADRNSLAVEDVVPAFVVPRSMESIAPPPKRDSVLTNEERAELEQLRRQLGFN